MFASYVVRKVRVIKKLAGGELSTRSAVPYFIHQYLVRVWY